jgi:hypothetical protein
MATISLKQGELIRRSNTLYRIFAPLRERRSRVAVLVKAGTPGGTTALVASDERQGSRDYREASFRTKNRAIRCSYFELWKIAGGRDLLLDRAYFTVLRVVPATREFRELLCVHADPAAPLDLKQGPHLHISCAPDPIPHCHFPLEFGFLPVVLADCGSLTAAIARAIRLVAIEVLPRFESN